MGISQRVKSKFHDLAMVGPKLKNMKKNSLLLYSVEVDYVKKPLNFGQNVLFNVKSR